MNNLTRRKFLGSIILIASSSGLVFRYLSQKKYEHKTLPLEYSGQDAEFLHQLRDTINNKEYWFNLINENEVGEFDCIVLGGGVSGLSALYHLEKKSNGNFALIEAQSKCGGNSQYGENEISSYPYGAHYLPLPDKSLKELISFLEDIEVCKIENGNPVYNPEYLIHFPETKLKYRGNWYEGLIPLANLNQKDKEDLEKFNKIIETYKKLIGSDSKKAFSIPISDSSSDQKILELDSLTASDFLINEEISSPFVHWYVNYGTRDDYGLSHHLTSAWAAIHYFASRREKEDSHLPGLLTWPEGNGFLIKGFENKIKSKIHSNLLVLKILEKNGCYYVFSKENGSQNIKIKKAKKIISALPHFVNKKVFDQSFSLSDVSHEYSPWLVANLSIKNLPDEFRDIPWDSVSYHHESLGFVRSDHQNLGGNSRGSVLTYYYPFSKENTTSERNNLQNLDLNIKTKEILEELDNYYLGLSKSVTKIDYWIWGHAMCRPYPGIMKKVIGRKTNKAHDGLYLAHTDYSGISIFEEAFYQGFRAANAISL